MDSYSSTHSLMLHSVSISHTYCITSIISLLFSILKSLSSTTLSSHLSSQSVTLIASTLCSLLPYSDHCITDWVELLLECYPLVDFNTQIELLKAIRFLIVQDSPSLDSTNDEAKSRILQFLIDESVVVFDMKNVTPVSVEVLFHKQQKLLQLLRLLLSNPSWNSIVSSSIQSRLTNLHSLSYAFVFAMSSIFGGDMIGLFEGCQAVYLPSQTSKEINETMGVQEIYKNPERCEVRSIQKDRDYLQILIHRTNGEYLYSLSYRNQRCSIHFC